jgi:hypothetical protein
MVVARQSRNTMLKSELYLERAVVVDESELPKGARGTLGLNDHGSGNWLPRQVDGEHASSPGQVARVDPPLVRFSPPSAEDEANTDAGSIGAALLERAKQLLHIPTRQPAALVLDFDEHARGAGP